MSAASIQSRLASMHVGRGPLSPLRPPTPTPLVKDLLKRNDEEHDIWFGDSHFHNHFPHTLLSQFGLGAPDSRLKKEWEIEDYLKPIQEKQPTEITDGNWTEYIGKDNYYHNYLDYFKYKIGQYGVQKTVVDYVLNPALIPSFVSGAVHPLIHTGFGLEFGSDLVVAEGLSEACVHSPAFAPVVDPEMYSKPLNGKRSLLGIVDEIYKDKTFDGVVKFTDGSKSTSVLKSNRATDAIKEYVLDWSFQATPDGFAKGWTELFELVTHFTCSSGFPPPHIVNDPKYKGVHFRVPLDFFLLHTLTGTYASRQLLPYVPMHQRTLVLRTVAAVALTYYISRGRPLLQPDKLPKSSYSWEKIVETTWSDEDLHVPKAVRALKVIADNGEMDKELAKNAAALIVQRKVEKHEKWSFLGHGFDEAWDELAKEDTKQVNDRR